MKRSLAARRSPEPDIAAVAALIGEPARGAMLTALLGGRALAAGELAQRAGVSPPAATAHLNKLLTGGLVRVQPAGRQRLFRMAGPEVGQALEALAVLARPVEVVALSQNLALNEMRAARTCYDHLAGRLGVGLTEALAARSFIVREGSASFELTEDGAAFLEKFGVDVAEARAKKRCFARQCIDLTERRPHLAGALGAALCECLFTNGWIERRSGRAVRLTPLGSAALAKLLSIGL
jgi:DNA-binding transcriptional ArsR family regulator